MNVFVVFIAIKKSEKKNDEPKIRKLLTSGAFDNFSFKKGFTYAA
jgi:hypothetical protein